VSILYVVAQNWNHSLKREAASMLYQVLCHRCGFEQTIDRKLFRQDICPRCSSYLRCCLLCRHYDRQAYHECKESEATWVRDKEAANFCDYFELINRAGSDKGQDPAAVARQKLAALFKKTDAAQEEGEA
jgi:hypothetical protein